MTTVGIPVPVVPNINNRTLQNDPSLFGCDACHLNQSQSAKRGKKRRHVSSSSSGNSLSPVSVSKKSTNSYRTGSRLQHKSMTAVGIKQESLKHAHSQVQDLFAQYIAASLHNPHGLELQCCITYSKPCGCIRKFILGGEKWKEIENQHLHLRQVEDIDPTTVSTMDKSMVNNEGLMRANDLVAIYEKAAELKKEKCYAFNNVEVEGKTLKELRGMIGLGNGRKRSKKYEDYVLATRSVLRNQYALCEKAAQKLLGYSINFLYKKLRTNPSKTSRLVATNKAERASKAPRHLIPLEELREMGRKTNGGGQCCGRNCISRLASQHFDKIENWRKRLEGSGQRVAQEIVAEVLRASSSSLDGQSSFCQNLVHWVTGCSFKKIRRVRDHLKKDPQSLPEHGLKKYWKDKAKKQGKVEPVRKQQQVFKKEKPEPDMIPMSEMYYGMHAAQHFNGFPNSMYANGTPPRLTHFQPGSSDTRDTMVSQWTGTNLNNSNNMVMAGRAPPGFSMDMGGESHPIFGVVQAVYPQHLQEDKNRGTPDRSQVAANSCQYQDPGRMPPHAQPGGRAYEPMDVQYASNTGHQGHMVPGQQQGLTVDQHPPRRLTRSPYEQNNVQDVSEQRFTGQMLYPTANMNMKNTTDPNGMPAGQGAPRSSVIIHTAGPQHQQPQQEPPPYNQNGAPVNGGGVNGAEGYNSNQAHNSGQNDMSNMAFNTYGQHYYIANGYDGANFFQGGMAQGLTPFVLSQQGDEHSMENVDDKNGEGYYPRQPVYIFSPIPADGKAFTPNDLQNWKQMPLTPFQILTTPYLPGRGGEHGGEQAEEGQEPQRFLFPMPIQNPENFEYDRQEGNQNGKGTSQDSQMQCLQTAALTPLVVHKGGGGFLNFGSWPAPNQQEGTEQQQAAEPRVGYDMQILGGRDGQQWPLFKLQQYPPNVNLEHLQSQAIVAHDSQQQYQQMQYPITNAPAPQAENPQVKQPYATAESWPGDRQPKKPNPAPFTNAAQGGQVSVNPGVSYPPANTMYLPQNQMQQGKQAGEETTEENPDEKEGGIVTPNIIREALSKFPSHAVSAAEPPKEQDDVPTLAPIAKKNVEKKAKPGTPPLEMPKLAPLATRNPSKQGEEGKLQSESDTEAQCASISARAKRFSRDRLRATIDSPNIVLTPFTPLTPSITPMVVIPDTSDDENTGKDDGDNSASSTNSQKRDSSIFLFPPTHVSRRRAAIRLQGQTVSDIKQYKGKGGMDSPGTPGPFPVAEGSASPTAVSTAGDSGVSSASTANLVTKKDGVPAQKVPDDAPKPVKKDKSPTLTLRNLSQSGVSNDNIVRDKIPVLSFDAAGWSDDPTIPSPNTGDNSEDAALNTPTQQQLNTPTSQLNTPTQLNTPNQDLRTPTESPIKSLNAAPAKRKREASPVPEETQAGLSEDDFSAVSTRPSATAAKNLRFHCFTPKDFNDGMNCSAFRKPSEFASAPAESAIAQRRRRPRKQANPSAMSGAKEKGEVGDMAMEDLPSPVEIIDDTEEDKFEEKDAAEPEKMDISLTPVNSAANQSAKQAKPSMSKASLPGFPRKSDNIMLLGNPYEGMQPSLFQLVTPSFPNSAGSQQAVLHQQPPYSGQQVNTPVFLHSATFLTPGGSGVVRKISPSAVGAPSSTGSVSNTPQIFTFMPGSMLTPTMMMQNRSPGKKTEKPADGDKSNQGKSEDASKADGGAEGKKSVQDKQRLKRSAMTLPVGDLNTPPAGSPFTGKESGLQTPSNLKVVTPSLNPSSAAEGSQIFNFPSAGMPIYQMPNPSSRSMQRGGYIFCTPSKASPTGSKILYQPCTSPSMANGPLALVSVEMLSGPPKKFRPDKKGVTTPTKGDSPLKSPSDAGKGAVVPMIVVDSPTDGGGGKAKAGHREAKDDSKCTEPGSTRRPMTSDSSKSTEKNQNSPSKISTSSSGSTSPSKRKKSTGSPKEFPKPLVMSHVNTEGPNVQTPTLIHLVSPSQHSPNSPSLVFYPMIRPHGPGQPGSKLQSPLSAGSTGSTPPVIMLQRIGGGPGGSSSLLKSALMKSMPVFQFPPPHSQQTPTSASAEDSSKSPEANPSSTSVSIVSASESTSSSKTASSSSTSPSAETPTSAGTPSAAVSVICGPRMSTPRYTDKLSGLNDPCLSEAAQEN